MSDKIEVDQNTNPNDANSYPIRTLTAEESTNGSIASTDSHKLGANTTVTATPDLGYLFTAWTGDASGSDNPLTITMDGNKAIGATFTKDTADTDGDGFSNYDELVVHETDPADANNYPIRTLTAEESTNGSIASTDSHKLGANTTVTATPDLGYLFTAWTGDASGSDNPLTITMDGNKAIGATFTKDTADTDGDGFSNYDELVVHETDPADANNYPIRTLTAEESTNGSIASTDSHKLGANTTVTATPDLGYLFTAWTGDASGSDNPLTITMDGNGNDTEGFSNYDELLFTLQMQTTIQSVDTADSLMVILASLSLWMVIRPSGRLSPKTLTLMVTVHVHETDPADANNYPIRTLTAEESTNGSIASTDSHKLGANTTVTATPDLGYLFTAWTGDASGSDNPLTITMDGNKAIGATFTKDTADMMMVDGFSLVISSLHYDELVVHELVVHDPADANNYPIRTLTAEESTNGSIASTDSHKLGANTTVTATPDLGYLFTAWTGDASGSDNPLTITMDGNKAIGATFTKDTADTDGDGFSNYDELVVHETDPADANSYPGKTLNLKITRNGNTLLLEWNEGRLQKSTNLQDGWFAVTEDDGSPVTSPYQINLNNDKEFFRVSE